MKRVVFISVALLAWLALALPAQGAFVPEDPRTVVAAPLRAELPSTSATLLPSEEQITTESAPAPPSPASVLSSNVTLPHKAIAGRVAAEPVLASPHLDLARPFDEPFRRTPEPFYPYGSRGNGRYVLHTGVDISNPMGTPVRAVSDGTVVYAGSDAQVLFGPYTGYYGNLIVTQVDTEPDTQPIYVLFGHLDRVLVSQGQRVSTGDVIGLVGMTGIAIGPHLHLEVRQGEPSYQSTRNPALWLSNLPGRGTLAARITDEAGNPVAGERVLIYRASQGGGLWRVAKSYLSSPLIQGDDTIGENLVVPDMPAGVYRLVAGVGGNTVHLPLTIEPGRLSLVDIQVQSEP